MLAENRALKSREMNYRALVSYMKQKLDVYAIANIDQLGTHDDPSQEVLVGTNQHIDPRLEELARSLGVQGILENTAERDQRIAAYLESVHTNPPTPATLNTYLEGCFAEESVAVPHDLVAGFPTQTGHWDFQSLNLPRGEEDKVRQDHRKASQQMHGQPLGRTRLDELFLSCDDADFHHLEPTEFEVLPNRGDTDTDVEDDPAPEGAPAGSAVILDPDLPPQEDTDDDDELIL